MATLNIKGNLTWTALEPPRRGRIALDPNVQTFFICIKSAGQHCHVEGWSERQRIGPTNIRSTIGPYVIWSRRRADVTITKPPGGYGTAKFELSIPRTVFNSQLIGLDGLEWTVASCFPAGVGMPTGITCLAAAQSHRVRVDWIVTNNPTDNAPCLFPN